MSEPKAPAFGCVYARPKAGKTTDCGYSFPTALFLLGGFGMLWWLERR